MALSAMEINAEVEAKQEAIRCLNKDIDAIHLEILLTDKFTELSQLRRQARGLKRQVNSARPFSHINGFYRVQNNARDLNGVGWKRVLILASIIESGVDITLELLADKKAISNALYLEIQTGVTQSNLLQNMKDCIVV